MQSDPRNSAFDMFRMMANAAQAFSRFPGPGAGGPAAGMPAGDNQRILQLYLAFVNSGYRYLARWAEISARRYPEFAQTMATMNAEPAASARQMAALLDSVRGYLREMAELPLAESERLQAEVEAIVAVAAPSPGPAAEPAPKARPKRRARAKA
jgi:uncharacterized heparinase superfamily protein